MPTSGKSESAARLLTEGDADGPLDLGRLA